MLTALRKVVDRRFATGLLVMSMLIDVDQMPGLLGLDWITRGAVHTFAAHDGGRRSRRGRLGRAPVAVARSDARNRPLSGPRPYGFWIGVPLAWPLSLRSFTLPHWIYLLAMSAVSAVALLARTRPRASRPRSGTAPRRPRCRGGRVTPGRELGRRSAASAEPLHAPHMVGRVRRARGRASVDWRVGP
jgi:hypothetical protein